MMYGTIQRILQNKVKKKIKIEFHILTYDCERYGPVGKLERQRKSTEIKFFRKTKDCMLRNPIRSEDITKRLNIFSMNSRIQQNA